MDTTTPRVEARLREVTRLGYDAPHAGQGEEHDRHVDEQDRPPPHAGVEHRAADQRAERHGEARGAGPDRDGAPTLALVERVGDDR
jgi:hypothetical protein